MFGGTYMVLSYAGMLMAPALIRQWRMKSLILMAACTSILLVWVFRYNIVGKNFFVLDAKLPFGNGINPPGITLMFYALVVLLWCFSVVSICESGNLFVKKIIAFAGMIGRNSLYIFLYHRLALDFVLYPHVTIENMWVKRIVYIFCMMGLPVLGNKAYLIVKKKWRQEAV